MYGECEGSQDKKIMMVSIGKGPQEWRCGMKGRDEEKSTTQEENRNSKKETIRNCASDNTHNVPLD